MNIDITERYHGHYCDIGSDCQWPTIDEKHSFHAASRGVSVQHAEPHQAFIDIDSDEAYAIFLHRWERFHDADPKATYVAVPSPSGKYRHFHIIVNCGRDLDPYERLWIQAILGDDPLRNLSAYRDVRTYGGPERVSILFKKCEAVL